MKAHNPVPNHTPFPNTKRCIELEKEDLSLDIEQVTQQMTTNYGENIHEMSSKSNILLIFRRYVKYEGCGFCNRRMNQLMEFYRTLRQYNIVPVIVYPEDVDEGENFFSKWKIPEIQTIARINDPDQKFASKFNIFYDYPPLTTYIFHLIPHLARVHMEGFNQKVRSNSKYFNNSFRIKPCMFLIRNGKIARSWRHNYADACPNIIRDLVLHMDKTIASPITDLIIDNLLANTTNNSNATSSTQVVIEMEEGANQQSAQPISTDQVTTVNTTFSNMGGIMRSIESLLASVPRYKMIQGTSDLQELTLEMKQSMEQDRLSECKSKERKIPKSSSCFATEIEFYQDIDPNTIDVNMVLQTDHFRKYFKIMSSKEYNSENIIFWEDINLKYKPLTSKFTNFSKAKIVAESIGKYFLFEESSLMYVNTRDKLRQDVKFKLSELFSENVKEDFFLSQAPFLFDEVLNEMTASVFQDMFIRFSVSDLFSEMIQTSNARKLKL